MWRSLFSTLKVILRYFDGNSSVLWWWLFCAIKVNIYLSRLQLFPTWNSIRSICSVDLKFFKVMERRRSCFLLTTFTMTIWLEKFGWTLIHIWHLQMVIWPSILFGTFNTILDLQYRFWTFSTYLDLQSQFCDLQYHFWDLQCPYQTFGLQIYLLFVWKLNSRRFHSIGSLASLYQYLHTGDTDLATSLDKRFQESSTHLWNTYFT